MTAIDWSAMTPREVFSALERAPRVCGPWVDRANGVDAERRLISEDPAAEVGQDFDDGSWDAWIESGWSWSGFDTRESAMAAADEELRRRGWILVDDAKGGGGASSTRSRRPGARASPRNTRTISPAALDWRTKMLDPLTPNERRALRAVADRTCFVAMSATLVTLYELGCLECDAMSPIPWQVTTMGYEQLAIGEEVCDAE